MGAHTNPMQVHCDAICPTMRVDAPKLVCLMDTQLPHSRIRPQRPPLMDAWLFPCRKYHSIGGEGQS